MIASRAVGHGPLPLLLRWLGLSWASIGWACAGAFAGSVRAQGAAAPVTADVVRAVLHELDALFARGDVAGYLALFVPDHPGAHALLQRRLERLVASAPARERTSAIVGQPRTVGERTVVQVRHDVVLHGGDGGDARFTADSVLALRLGARAGDRATPTFAIEIADGNGEVRDDRLRCTACNYEIGGVSGWLCVAPRADTACSFETASFYLIGTDVACDVSVLVDTPVRAANAAAAGSGAAVPAAGGTAQRLPTVVAQELADALHEVEPTARPGVAEAWLPCSLAKAPPRGFAGARVEVDLPDCPDGGARAIFHVAAVGALQHLLLARGSVASLQRHAGALAALLASYRLLDTDPDAATAAANALAQHTGGALDRGTYRNAHHRVELDGPAGWQPVQHAGGAAFRVVWSGPDGGRLWLTGQRVPSGMRRWCEATADHWLQELCERHGLTIAPAASGTQAWAQMPECGALARTIVAMPAAGAAPQPRWIRVLLLDDLLVVADGFAATTADETALRTALASLRRM